MTFKISDTKTSYHTFHRISAQKYGKNRTDNELPNAATNAPAILNNKKKKTETRYHILNPCNAPWPSELANPSGKLGKRKKTHNRGKFPILHKHKQIGLYGNNV